MQTDKEAWLIATLDAIAQFRATKEPLKNVVKRVAVQRRLGARDRAKMSEAAFFWSRKYELGQEHIAQKLKSQGIGRPTIRQMDEFVLSAFCEGEESSPAEFPEWFIKKITSGYKEGTEALLQSLTTRAGPTLAVDTRYAKVSSVLEALDELDVKYVLGKRMGESIRILQSPFRLEALPKALHPHVWVMDESSQFAASQVQAAPEEMVLDYCAGGGGKTRFLSSRGAKLVAMDISERRLLNAKERCDLDEVLFVVADGRDPPFEDETFDWVIVDAPCSGTGTLRRAPDLLLRLKESEIAEFVKLQREILQGAFRVLKPNGVLIYATCSLFKEENADQVEWALKKFNLELETSVQLLPSTDETDGFFVATLKKGV